MKNKILIFAVTFVFFALATTAFAMTTVSLSPANVSVEEGQTFNLIVSLNSQTVKSYMVKLEIKFPADILEVESFNFGNNWVQLSQPGYNLVNNAGGVLIKTAGYPGGLSLQADFGTIVFKAKKSGTGAVQVTVNSEALNAESLNVMNGLPVQINFAVTQKPVVSPAPETVIPSTPKTEAQPITTIIPILKENTATNLPVTEEKTVQPTTVPQTGLVAAIATTLYNTKVVLTSITIVVLGLAAFWFVRKNKK